MKDQVTLVEGDINRLDFDNDNDVVLISGVVLIKPEDECRHIFQRAYGALVSGGMVIVQDFMRVDYSAQRSFLDIMMDMYVLVGFDPGAGDPHPCPAAAAGPRSGRARARLETPPARPGRPP